MDELFSIININEIKRQAVKIASVSDKIKSIVLYLSDIPIADNKNTYPHYVFVITLAVKEKDLKISADIKKLHDVAESFRDSWTKNYSAANQNIARFYKPGIHAKYFWDMIILTSDSELPANMRTDTDGKMQCYPANEETKLASGLVGHKPKDSRFKKTKDEIRKTAKRLWKKDSSITKVDMSMCDEISLISDACEVRPETIQEWIKDLNPNRKPGRRKKND